MTDRILRETRWFSAAGFTVLFLAFVTLYFWPDETERLFAWTIKPLMTPLLMGAGYLAGAYFFGRVLLEKRWHRVGLAILPIAAFSWFMGVATYLHWDRFNHEHPWFFVWVVVYTLAPILLPMIWLRNRSTDPRSPGPDDVIMPRALRIVLALGGAAELGVGLFMFLLPDSAIHIWPWSLTPLTARIVGGWFALPGVSGLLMARDLRWSASRVLVQGGVLLAVFLLIGIARAWSDFDPANPLTWIYTGLIVLTLIGFAAVYAGMERQRRKANPPRETSRTQRETA